MKKIKRKGVHCTFLGFLHCTTLLAVTSITLFGFLSSLAFNNRIEKFNTNNKISGGPYFQGGPGPEAVPLLPPSRAGPAREYHSIVSLVLALYGFFLNDSHGNYLF